MERTIHYFIPAQYIGKPIDLFLRSMGYSSQNIIALKKMPESILINNNWEYVTYRFQPGDQLTIQVKEQSSSTNIQPVDLPFHIVYEDADLLVVNKSSNMPIHPSYHNYDNTLANAVMYYFGKKDIPYTFRCINRLDRDTTGLTILAKHMISAGILSSMVQKHDIQREYIAITAGAPSSPSGIIDAPIARHHSSSIERIIDEQNGEHAVTHFEVLDQIQGNELLPFSNLIRSDEVFSKVSLWLETGRTHQIRVHMKSIGCPLIGDFLYHPDMRLIQRQALHSARLTFCHPITNEPLQFTAPLPNDMQTIFSSHIEL